MFATAIVKKCLRRSNFTPKRPSLSGPCVAPSQNAVMTEPGELSDAELSARAYQWRRQALHGELHARGHAHEHEAEMRRRIGGAAATPSTTETMSAQVRRRPFWRFW